MLFIKYDLKTNKMTQAKNIDNGPATLLLWKRLYPQRSQVEMIRWGNQSYKIDHSAKSIMGSDLGD